LRNHLEFDEAKPGVEEDYREHFSIKVAHLWTEGRVNAFRAIERLLGKGIFANEGTEAESRDKSSGFGLRQESAQTGR
jgi:hypothetical protein